MCWFFLNKFPKWQNEDWKLQGFVLKSRTKSNSQNSIRKTLVGGALTNRLSLLWHIFHYPSRLRVTSFWLRITENIWPGLWWTSPTGDSLLLYHTKKEANEVMIGVTWVQRLVRDLSKVNSPVPSGLGTSWVLIPRAIPGVGRKKWNLGKMNEFCEWINKLWQSLAGRICCPFCW